MDANDPADDSRTVRGDRAHSGKPVTSSGSTTRPIAPVTAATVTAVAGAPPVVGPTITSTVISAVTQTDGPNPIPATEASQAVTTLAVNTSAPTSIKALRQLLMSAGLVSAIAVGQVILEVLPQAVDVAKPIIPPNLAWLPGALTAGAATASVWLLALARKNHVVAVKDALYTDTQRKFYTTK